jgi:UDP-glucose/galactose:(glucosyl)LPS alpha-1,2-glucosyl/galactosyltransferase
MNILFCFDQKYEQHFGVALTSLIENNYQENRTITIHFLTPVITKGLRKKINQLSESLNISICPYEVDSTKLENLRTSAHISSASYYRLIAPSILPGSLDKILYLDCDLIVDGSVQSLYDLDISDRVVAACGGKTVTNKKRLNLSGDYYFNAGVILINLKMWRDLDIGNQCLQWLNDYPNVAQFHDQDALNKIIDGNFINIDSKWNSTVDLYKPSSKITNESVIIHFIGSLKPWQLWCIRPIKAKYWFYHSKSLWSDSLPEIPTNFKSFVKALRSIYHQFRTRHSVI